MPITEELKTAQELRDAGLPQRVAEVLAAKFETTAQATRETAVEAFRAEIKSRFDALGVQLASLQTEIAHSKAVTEKSMRSVQGTILAAVIGAASLIIATLIGLKMF